MEKTWKTCPLCKCLILENGYCRNSECKFGNSLAVTTHQLRRIDELCERLDIPVSSIVKNPALITKEEAKYKINKLVAKVAIQRTKEIYEKRLQDS